MSDFKKWILKFSKPIITSFSHLLKLPLIKTAFGEFPQSIVLILNGPVFEWPVNIVLTYSYTYVNINLTYSYTYSYTYTYTYSYSFIIATPYT